MVVFKVKKEDGSYIEINFCEKGLYIEFGDYENGMINNFIIDNLETQELIEYLTV